MCGHLNPKRLQIETVIGQITNRRIQLLLSIKVERPENLTFDKMKYEFSKPFCPPIKSDLESDEKWATEPDITLQKKVCIKGILWIFWLYKCLSNKLVILLNSGDSRRFANHQKRDETNTLPSIDKTLTALSIGPITMIKNLLPYNVYFSFVLFISFSLY